MTRILVDYLTTEKSNNENDVFKVVVGYTRVCGPEVTLEDFAWFGAKAQSNTRVCVPAPSDISKYKVEI